MRRLLPLLVFPALLAGAPASWAAAQPPATAEPAPTLRSYQQAREVLDRAVAAHGGEAAIRGIEDVTVVFQGTVAELGQGPRPNVPATPAQVDGQIVLNLREGWDFYERTDRADGTGIRTFLRGDEGVRHQFPETPPVRLEGNAARNVRFQLQRRDPCLLLRSALERHQTLRSLGRVSFDGAEHDVISFTQENGTALSLFVDSRTHLVSKSEVLSYNAIYGDTVEEARFGEYREVQGLKMPFTRRLVEVGRPFRDKTHTAVRINTHPAAPEVEIPPAAPAAQAAAAAPEDPSTVVELAPGVFLLKGMADGTYHSLFVAFDDHVLVVEAPFTSAVTEKAVERIKAAAPGKPIRYVVPTHHHSDHLAGIRGFIAEGATVVTTPGNREYVAAAASGRRQAFNTDRLARSPRTAAIEVIEGRKRVFEDAHHRVEIHDLGPTPHAEEIVVAYLPKEGILFQADLFNLAAPGPPLPPDQRHPVTPETTAALVQAIRQRGWQVRSVAGVHGEVATLAQVEAAARAAKQAR